MGLKAFRANKTAKKPEYHCSNCGCQRYSPCGCPKNVVGGVSKTKEQLVKESENGESPKET